MKKFNKSQRILIHCIDPASAQGFRLCLSRSFYSAKATKNRSDLASFDGQDGGQANEFRSIYPPSRVFLTGKNKVLIFLGILSLFCMSIKAMEKEVNSLESKRLSIDKVDKTALIKKILEEAPENRLSEQGITILARILSGEWYVQEGQCKTPSNQEYEELKDYLEPDLIWSLNFVIVRMPKYTDVDLKQWHHGVLRSYMGRLNVLHAFFIAKNKIKGLEHAGLPLVSVGRQQNTISLAAEVMMWLGYKKWLDNKDSKTDNKHERSSTEDHVVISWLGSIACNNLIVANINPSGEMANSILAVLEYYQILSEHIVNHQANDPSFRGWMTALDKQYGFQFTHLAESNGIQIPKITTSLFDYTRQYLRALTFTIEKGKYSFAVKQQHELEDQLMELATAP